MSRRLESRSARRKRRFVQAGAIAALMALLLGLVAAGLDTGGDDQAETTTTTQTTIPLNDEARELLALLEKDRDATFHARYAASSAKEPNAAIQIETWRKPPRVRQDTIITTGANRLHSMALLLGDGQSVQCAQLGQSGWSCQSKPAGPTDDLLLGGVREQLGKGPVTAKDDVIDGRQVRCFTLTVEGQASELCATEAGIPVRVNAQGSNLRLVGFDAQFDDSVFTPPAQPVPAAGT